MNAQQVEELFNDPDRYTAAHFSVQLPYLNDKGSPICIDTTHGYASSLVQHHKTHRLLQAEPGYYVLTPIVPARTGVVFQIGEAAI
jgi:hypothetical protein